MKKLHKIAIIDPHVELAKAYQKRLRLEDFETYVFENAEDAISVILELPFDAVITEHSLPDIEFIDLYDLLRSKATAYNLPILVLTNDDISKMLEYDGLDIENTFVKSNTHPNEIIQRLRYLLRTE